MSLLRILNSLLMKKNQISVFQNYFGKNFKIFAFPGIQKRVLFALFRIISRFIRKKKLPVLLSFISILMKHFSQHNVLKN